ncbi:phosphoenolpyruvate synthase [Clostridium felsineum]|uniref:Uncharacterized protein n=1 Tax=Clostridium felsineum TaxID=36839 RepID=A0A1S8M8R1_9CLOT|nr:phosphoenolpyruvate synthase [Clostridium felsineum]URZ05600.1 hypothetical protein CLROS_009260 [Clostridium felsineum]URZ10639.1 hypothetical protein CROST_013490 [Clostridium felsineum]
MNKYILGSNEDKCLQMGTKAANLVKLKKNNINVPNFFCISYECMEYHLKESRFSINNIIDDVNFQNEEAIKNAKRKIIRFFEHIKIEESIKKEIYDYIEKHFKAGVLFSVRSSSLLEDSAEFSFAGQFETFLNVSKEELLKSIVRCWSSLYAENVLKYSYDKKLSIYDLKMNVIIQEMISADLSGVIFTANPQGILNEMVLVCGKGTGNLVVEDKTPTTTYYYNITDKIYYYENQENSPILENDVFMNMVNISNTIMKAFGKLLDIEFAMKNSIVYILQVRPITTLMISESIILDNSNIVESYPNITLPLTTSFIREAYYGVFRGLTLRCFKNEKLVESYEEVLKEMVDSANGRMYYKISNWYTIIKFLPFSKKIIPIWQEMMGVSNKVHSKEKKDIKFYTRVSIYINVIVEAFRVRKEMDKLNCDFNKVKEQFDINYSDGLTNEGLIKLYGNIEKVLLKNWDITLLNDLYAFVFTGLLKARMKKLKIENIELEINNYISGVSNIESLKPIKKLIELSKKAVEGKDVIETLYKLKNDNMVYEYLNKSASDYSVELREYIDLYGDRSLEELKLESKTFRSSPILLINKILEYTEHKDKLNDMWENLCKPSCSNISKEILEEYSVLDRFFIKIFSKKALLGIQNREISRLNRSRVYGMVRSIFLTIGKNFVEANKLNAKDDIFYLHTYEVFEHIKGKEYDFKKLVCERKKEYEMYEKLPAYSRLEFSKVVFNKNHSNINDVKIRLDKNEIVGIPCSNGIVEGEVVVIENPKLHKDVKDKILVTKMTDPGWVFLLTMAKGIIAEKGSLLSHTAIISRELKVPSIVGAANITKILKSGDKIRMNGSTGKVERISD